MPELPDVEIFKRGLDAHGLKRRVDKVTVSDARILGDLGPTALAKAVEGRRFSATRRHGKHLLARLERDGWVTFHFGMTGDLLPFGADADEPRFTRVRFDFADGSHLAYVNRRMLGNVGLADDDDAFIAGEALGPDALDPAFDRAAFAKALGAGRRTIKTALMDQGAVAGIGNIYSDEMLFQARVHPETKVSDMGAAATARLFTSLRKVLKTAISSGAGSEVMAERLPKSFLIPQRRKGGRCPRCNKPIATLKAGGRTAYFCPHCQKAEPA